MPKRAGGIGLGHFLNDHGRIEGECTITRLADDRYYLLSGAAAEIRDFDWLIQHIEDGEDVTVTNVTDERGNLVLAGPKARDILAAVTDADLSNEGFKWLTGQEITVAGVALRALRVNYVGELGWELHAPMGDLPALYTAIWDAGQAHGLVNFGTYAVNSMRLEKGYKGYAAEMTNEITMIEADMERFCRFEKDDFVGKAATLQRKQDGVSQILVYAEMDAGDVDSRGGEAVMAGGTSIGITTSGGYGHRSGKSLVFAFVKPDFAAPGSTFDILVLGEARKATVLAEPVFDAGNERLRG